MSDNDNELGKLLEAFGYPDLTELLPPDVIAEAKQMLAEVGGLEALLTNKLPDSPPPRPNPLFGIPDPPIAAGLVEYRCSDEREGVVSPVSPIVITTARETLQGTIAWRLKSTMNDHGTAVEMDAIVRAADLRMMMHQGGMWAAQFRHTVVGEYVYVRASTVTDAQYESKRIPLPESAFPSLVTLWSALAAAPLERGWSANVHLYGKVALEDWRFVPLRLEVVDEERIDTPAGAFDCWVITAQGEPDGPITGRYWVSRGDPSMRVVARGHDGKSDGTTRRYELARLERGTIGGAAAHPDAQPGSPPAPPETREESVDGAPPPDAPTVVRPPEQVLDVPVQQAQHTASIEIATRRKEGLRTETIMLRRDGAARLSPDNIRTEALSTAPTLEWLRDAMQVPPGTSPEAIARYEREHAEFLDDKMAQCELMNVIGDMAQRTIGMQAIVRTTAEAPLNAWVRITVPPKPLVRLSCESVRVEPCLPPLPLTAPPSQHRKRFARRLTYATERFAGDIPSERFTAPDGSTIVVHGPAPVSAADPMEFMFDLVFESWDDVAPFTLAYDVSVEGLATVQGTVYIGARRAN